MLSETPSSSEAPCEVKGKTVAKIVIPLHVFMQLESHLAGIFASVNKDFILDDSEAPDEHSAVI
jgi:hypothetical protein